MATYYQNRTVRITSTGITVNKQSYLFEDLTDVHHDGFRRGLRAWAYSFVGLVVVLMLFALIPITIVALVIAVRQTSGFTERVTVSGFVLGGAGALWLYRFHVNIDDHTIREIRARWQGEEIVLVRTDNVISFGRIDRALQRASTAWATEQNRLS